MSDAFYGVEWDDDCDWDEQYDMLRGPDGFECLLTEPEDRIWLRDGKPVVKKLNEQADTIAALTARLAEAEALLREACGSAYDQCLYVDKEWYKRTKAALGGRNEQRP